MDGRVEIRDAHGKVLTPRRRNLAGDEVELLIAGVEPRAVETEVGPVIPAGEPEYVGLEPHGGSDVVDVDRDVVHTQRFHEPSLLRPHYVQSIASALQSLVSPIGGVVSLVRALHGDADTGRLVYLASAGRGRHPDTTPPLIGVGVGASDDQAQDDALRRCLGLYAAANWEAPAMQWASADELGDEALPVEDLSRTAPLETRDRIRWVEGFALDDGRPIWVPAVLVHLGLPVAVEAEAFWPASLAGLAVADGLGAAVLAGLLDLVARDAFAVASVRDAPLPQVSGDADEVALFDATGDLGIPTALAQGPTSFEFGLAAEATFGEAREAAIDDLARRRARRSRDSYPQEPAPDPAAAPEGRPSAPNVEPPIDLSKPAIVRRLRRVGLAGYAIDVTTEELNRVGLSAVRVIVPGLSPVPPSPGWTDHARLARVAP